MIGAVMAALLGCQEATPGAVKGCGQRYYDERVLRDPCGGGYVADCRCGRLSPRFDTETEASTWLDQHIAETEEIAA